mmetsp:Transcript_36038/g.34105  ORF Transcript_36038/g.34105 Transcript_36038/m.34105 type:complete len:235 (-) Transcript_36038:7-711(-)
MYYSNIRLCSLILSIIMSFSIFNCKALSPPTKMIRSYATSRICMKTINHEYSQITKILIRPTDWKIDHTTPIHLIGSCFTDTISISLKSYKFNSYSNGQGIMFNPISISKCLDNVIKCKVFDNTDIFKDAINSDTYHSWNHHSSFSSLSAPDMIQQMNNEIIAAHNHLLSAKTLFITLGTAKVHLLNENNEVVANCHKQPAHLFKKKLLKVDEVVQSLSYTLKECKKINPDLKV